MTVRELSGDQMTELKQVCLLQELETKEHRTPSWGELAEVDKVYTDAQMYEWYQGVTFTDDDFCCSSDYPHFLDV